MIKRILLWLLREEFAAVETLAYNNLQAHKTWIVNSVAMSFTTFRKDLDYLTHRVGKLETDFGDLLSDSQDKVAVFQTGLEVVAREVDLLSGVVSMLEDSLHLGLADSDMEMNDLEERIKDLEDSK